MHRDIYFVDILPLRVCARVCGSAHDPSRASQRGSAAASQRPHSLRDAARRRAAGPGTLPD